MIRNYFITHIMDNYITKLISQNKLRLFEIFIKNNKLIKLVITKKKKLINVFNFNNLFLVL